MMFYDFKKDLYVAQKTEHEILNKLKKYFDATLIEFSNNEKYDLKVLINNKIYKIEVKEDFFCKKSGNVALEYECRGKPSGINSTCANIQIYKIHTKENGCIFLIFRTSTLKQLIKTKKYFKNVCGGDKGSNTKMFLFKLDIFKKYANYILSEED